jgi:hypothetical protein
MRWMIVAAMLVCLPASAWAQISSARIERLRAAEKAIKARPEKPLDLTVSLDQASAARKIIGAAGGSLTLSTPKADYVLEIPPDALLYPEELTLTAVTAAGGLGPETKGILSVQVGPSGLPLAGHGWLTIKPKDPAAFAAGLYAFGFSKDGANAHYALRTPVVDGAVQVSVSHFSGFGVGLGTVASSVLAQTKPRLAPPNANQTAKDAAQISQDQHVITDAVNKSLEGDPDAKSDASFFDTVKALLGSNTMPGEGPGGGGLPAGGGCNVEAEIKFINDRRKIFDGMKGKSKVARESLAPSQWDSVKKCAEPPAQKCFMQGDPWPLAKYLQTVRTYKPEPSEAAIHGGIVAGLEDNLKRCTKFEFQMNSHSHIKDENVEWEIVYDGKLPLALNFMKTNGVTIDVSAVTGKGQITKSLFQCKGGRTASCTAEGYKIIEESRIEVTLKDFPTVSQEKGSFNPLLTPPVVEQRNTTRTPAGNFPIDIEIVNASWECVFGAQKSGKGYRFQGWVEGTYPELYTLKLNKSKQCERLSQPFTIELNMKLVHKPDGAFKPIP